MIRFFTSISAFIHDLLWTVSYKMTILHLHVALSRAAFGCLLEHVCSFWRTPPQCQLQILILWSFPVLCYFTIELRCREWCMVGSSNLIFGRDAPEGGRSHHVIGWIYLNKVAGTLSNLWPWSNSHTHVQAITWEHGTCRHARLCMHPHIHTHAHTCTHTTQTHCTGTHIHAKSSFNPKIDTKLTNTTIADTNSEELVT